jgi:predicted glycoside hydrolase/deacetylase ChbG (UPF0249 family)
MTGARKYLIVNADDFGLSRGINRGILKAHAQGIVTSASLMVRWPAAAEAAAAARGHPQLSIGLHVDLAEWACCGGSWQSLYEVVPLNDKAAVAAEVDRQLSAFRRLVGHDPAHLDSHQHVHRKEPVRSVLAEIAERLGVPLRHVADGIRYCGDFYAQDAEGNSYPEIVTVAGLTKIIAALPSGWTELACHPGDPSGEDLNTMYRRERAEEVNVLCDQRVREALATLDIELRSFAEFKSAAAPMVEGLSP